MIGHNDLFISEKNEDVSNNYESLLAHTVYDEISTGVVWDGEHEPDEPIEITVYSYRWLILLLFIISGVANALILLTWAPISDIADTYFGGIGITAVNLLNVIFQIMYLPGTLLALRISKSNSLRDIVLSGGLLTTSGCLLRYIGASTRAYGLSDVGSYILILIGTSLVGLAQPFYLNMPAKISTTWFPLNQRDFATTLCSLSNPLGSAIGSFIPPYFISDSSNDDSISTGINNLLLAQFAIAISAFFLVLFLFTSSPISAPSKSAKNISLKGSSSLTNNKIFQELKNLYNKPDYLKVFFSFTIVLGNLNALAALLNQLPGGYSNSQIGLTGAILIMSGFVGAFLTGILLQHYKTYTTIFKIAYVSTFVSWLFFLSNCRSNNFPLFIFSASLLGFCTLPTIPSTIVSAVECTYPIPEDASVGILYIGANVMAIAMTFIGQILLTCKLENSVAPFFPYGIWVISLLITILVPVYLFSGQYLRLNQDQ